jgi:hypothetical protein
MTDEYKINSSESQPTTVQTEYPEHMALNEKRVRVPTLGAVKSSKTNPPSLYLAR